MILYTYSMYLVFIDNRLKYYIIIIYYIQIQILSFNFFIVFFLWFGECFFVSFFNALLMYRLLFDNYFLLNLAAQNIIFIIYICLILTIWNGQQKKLIKLNLMIYYVCTETKFNNIYKHSHCTYFLHYKILCFTCK